jgi:1-deoxy-D-xylulose-5-phosphate reductoisomerase
MQGITILGSTGSVGVSTLDVISRHKNQYRVVAITANRQVDRLFQQCQDFKPDYAVMADSDAAEKLHEKLLQTGLNTKVLSGVQGLIEVCTLPQVKQVMAAIVGAAGLKPTLEAAKAGKRILLANKESLVMSGQLFIDTVRENNAELLPIDSEHNAIFQCLPSNDQQVNIARGGVSKILLTGSGGPFRTIDMNAIENVTPEEACAHPNWNMGKKISVDSATMMNKGLELIEACWLFSTTPDTIQIVVHPQSIIHSMVQYVDGSVLAQMGHPDMRTPIAHAMAWPNRIVSGVEPLDFFAIKQLDFEKPDYDRFPCLKLAENAAKVSGTAPAILNAANEIAVDAFLNKQVKFTQIAQIVEMTLTNITSSNADNLDVILEADFSARQYAERLISESGKGVLH